MLHPGGSRLCCPSTSEPDCAVHEEEEGQIVLRARLSDLGATGLGQGLLFNPCSTEQFGVHETFLQGQSSKKTIIIVLRARLSDHRATGQSQGLLFNPCSHEEKKGFL